MQKSVTRRQFAAAAGTCAAGLSCLGASAASASEASGPRLPESWDYEADIVVVGFGGAGCSAAITAADEGLGDVLVLEAGPEGEEGGNSRACMQVVFGSDDVEGLVTYQRNLNKPYSVDEGVLRSWAEGLVENVDWLDDQGGCMEQFTLAFAPEFPEVEGSEAGKAYLESGVLGAESTWKVLRARFEELGCRALYNMRVTRLIFDPSTKEVFGVRTEDGTAIKARKGVLLACGGFENSEELMDCYYMVGCKSFFYLGTPYNRGDGIKMCQEIGAGLWHMNNFSYGSIVARHEADGTMGQSLTLPNKDYIFVGPNGRRWMYEETQTLSKHGKTNTFGNYVQIVDPYPAWCIIGSDTVNAGDIMTYSPVCGWVNVMNSVKNNEQLLEEGILAKASTAEELAEMIGVDPAALARTIEEYNSFAAKNLDEEFGRGQDYYTTNTMENGSQGVPAVAGFDLVELNPPYYAIEIRRGAANTQGGPKHNADYQVVDTFDNPIPRLFAGGECAATYPYQYNGGGNLAEAISSGRIAARRIAALDSWE